MRRRISAVALATAALLTVTGVSAAAVHASVPAGVSAADPVVPVVDDAPAGPGYGTDAGTGAPTRAEREAALARGDRQAADLMGFLPSLYQGKWFKPGAEDVRRCIVLRESHANYRASNGTYFGAYQMSKALADGAAWMMQAEVRKEMGAEGVKLVSALRETTPNNWNRYWQDRAFWTIWRDGEGAHHWGGGAHSC
jgi:hypothetical protein